MLINIRDTVLNSNASPYAYKITQFNDYISLIHATEVALIDICHKSIENDLKGIPSTLAVLEPVGSDALKAQIKQHLDYLLK